MVAAESRQRNRDRPGGRKQRGAGDPARARRQRGRCEAGQQHGEAGRGGRAGVVCSDEALIEFAQRGGGSLSEAEDRICAALEVDGGRRHIGDRDQPRQSGRGRVKDPVEAPSHDCDRIPGDVVMRARRRQGDVDRERGGPGRNLDQRFVVLPAGEAGDTPAGDEGLQRLLARHARPRSGHEEPDGTAVCLRPHFLRRDDENGDGLGAGRSGSGQDAEHGHARDRKPDHAETVPPVTQTIGESELG